MKLFKGELKHAVTSRNSCPAGSQTLSQSSVTPGTALRRSTMKQKAATSLDNNIINSDQGVLVWEKHPKRNQLGF